MEDFKLALLITIATGVGVLLVLVGNIIITLPTVVVTTENECIKIIDYQGQVSKCTSPLPAKYFSYYGEKQ